MRVAVSRREEIDVGGHHAGLREIDVLAPNDRSTFLSTLPATRSDRRAALAIVGISAILFALAVPFAGLPLAQVPAFVASYQSALAVSDIITAVLPLSQFAVLRSRALLLLSIGYMFTAGAAVDPRPHLPRAVRPGRIVRCRLTDHRLALHDLARRFPAVRAGLCLAPRTATAATGLRASTALAIALSSSPACLVALTVFALAGDCAARPATGPA